MRAWLIFLGGDEGHRLVQPAGVRAGDALDLQLRHPERWRREDVMRVIVGSEPTWADLVLVDEPPTIRREHARLYLNLQQPDRSDFRAMKDCPAIINGQLHPPFEWVSLHSGDEIQLSCWRFRYESLA